MYVSWKWKNKVCTNKYDFFFHLSISIKTRLEIYWSMLYFWVTEATVVPPFKGKPPLKGKQLICYVDRTKQKEILFCEKELTSPVIVLRYNDSGHPWVIKAAWSPRLLLEWRRLANTMGKVRLLVLLCVFCACAYLRGLLSRNRWAGSFFFCFHLV